MYVYNNITDVSGAVVFTYWELGYGHSWTGKDLKCAATNNRCWQGIKTLRSKGLVMYMMCSSWGVH